MGSKAEATHSRIILLWPRHTYQADASSIAGRCCDASGPHAGYPPRMTAHALTPTKPAPTDRQDCLRSAARRGGPRPKAAARRGQQNARVEPPKALAPWLGHAPHV